MQSSLYKILLVFQKIIRLNKLNNTSTITIEYGSRMLDIQIDSAKQLITDHLSYDGLFYLYLNKIYGDTFFSKTEFFLSACYASLNNQEN